MKKWEKIVKMNENNIENKKRIIDLIVKIDINNRFNRFERWLKEEYKGVEKENYEIYEIYV